MTNEINLSSLSGKEPDSSVQTSQKHPYVGMWVTNDGNVRHELLPNGRYDEARGNKQSAYQGRYTITGNHIDYVDDTGFTADGDFCDDVLYHGGMILHRATNTKSLEAAPDRNKAVAGLHWDWVMLGWEYRASDGPFSFRQKLGKYYNWNVGDVILYDGFDPVQRVVRSAAEYGKVWEPHFNNQNSILHAVVDGPYVLVAGDMAASNLQFAARLESKTGNVSGIRAYSSLVWRLGDEGWTIVREHNSTVDLTADEVEALMRTHAIPRV